MAAPNDRGALGALASLFVRLGLTAFGGPAAHVAMMEHEVVRRRAWLSSEQFLELLGATALIPGPSSTELAIFIGHHRAGWRGLVVAGLSFIIPAALLTAALAWVYVHYGALPQADAALRGIKPVVIAIIVQALWNLAPTAVNTVPRAVIGVAALGATFAGVDPLIVLVGAGALGAGVHHARAGGRAAVALPPLIAGPAVAAAVPASVASVSVLGLFMFFLKVGALLFGSGYVLLAFLRADLVEHWHWLTESQLLAAVSIGQITPGPVFTTATFIGYLLGGATGALAATVAIFLPGFVYVAISGYALPRLRARPTFGSFLAAVNVATLALMAIVAYQLGRASLVDGWTIGIGVASAVVLVRFQVNSIWLVAGGALAGLALQMI